MATMTDPVVAVRSPVVDSLDPDNPGPVTLDDLLFADCSQCGQLTDWETNDEPWRTHLIRVASRHAAEVHDGLVVQEGWAGWPH